MASLEIRLLGTFSLRVDGTPAPALQQARLELLLSYLLIHRSEAIPRKRLAYLLWPDSSESQAHTNLRVLILRLKRQWPGSVGALEITRTSLRWRSERDTTVDLWQFDAELARAAQHRSDSSLLPEEELKSLERAVELYGGPFLPDAYDDWSLQLRDTYQNRYLSALSELVEQLRNRRRYDEAIKWAQKFIDVDPLSESAYLHLIELYTLMGNRAAALRIYHKCVARFHKELGAGPGDEIESAFQQLSQGSVPRIEADPPTEFGIDINLVGRIDEWRHLLETWRICCQGSRRMVLIWGEAGIGKSRLSEELVDLARRQQRSVATTRSYQAEGDLAYSSIGEWLRSPLFAKALQTIDDLWRVELARLHPELLLDRPDLPHPGPLQESWQRHRFYEAILRLLAMVKQPLLLQIDDLQWTDERSLELFHVILRKPDLPLLLLGTVRSEEAADNRPLLSLLDGLRQDGLLEEIHLGPLSQDESLTLANLYSDPPLDEHFAQQLVRESEGHPLFLVESVRNLVESGDGSGDAKSRIPIPSKLEQVIHARLEKLSSSAYETALYAAVVGRDFHLSILQTALALDEERMVEALDELWQRRIIRENESGYDFSHDRIREVTYARLGSARRRLLHNRVGHALIRQAGDRPDREAARIAFHLSRAGDQERACRFYRLAGEHELHQYRYAEGLRYFRRALSLSEPSHQDERFMLHLHIDDALAALGDREARSANLNEMERLLEGPRKDEASTRREGAILALRRSSYEMSRGAYRLAMSHSEEALAGAVAVKDRELEARVDLRIGQIHWNVANFEAASRFFERTIAIAREVGDSSLTAAAIERLAEAMMFSGARMDEITGLMNECLTLYEGAGDLRGRISIFNKLGYSPMVEGRGEFEQSQTNFKEGLNQARRIGHLGLEQLIGRNLGLTFACAGRYQDALENLNVAMEQAHAMGDILAIASTQNYLGFAYFCMGQLARAYALQAEVYKPGANGVNPHFQVKALTNMGWIRLYQDEFDGAYRHFSEAIELSRQIGEGRQEAYARIGRGHLLLCSERLNEADGEYEQAETLLNRIHVSSRAIEACAGRAWIRALDGENEQALSILEPVLAQIEAHRLDRTEDVFHLYRLCYLTLKAADDRRRETLLHQIHAHLRERASHLSQEMIRGFEALPFRDVTKGEPPTGLVDSLDQNLF